MADEINPYKQFADQAREQADAARAKETAETDKRLSDRKEAFKLAASPLVDKFLPEFEKAREATKGEYIWEIEEYVDIEKAAFSILLRGKPHLVVGASIPGKSNSGKIVILVEHGDSIKILAPDSLAKAGKPTHKDISSEFRINTLESAT